MASLSANHIFKRQGKLFYLLLLKTGNVYLWKKTKGTKSMCYCDQYVKLLTILSQYGSWLHLSTDTNSISHRCLDKHKVNSAYHHYSGWRQWKSTGQTTFRGIWEKTPRGILLDLPAKHAANNHGSWFMQEQSIWLVETVLARKWTK